MTRIRIGMLSVFAFGLLAQQPPAVPLPESIVARLPEAWRNPARSLTAPKTAVDQATTATDENLRYQIVTLLAQKSEGQSLLAAELLKEPSARVRARIVTSLRAYWASHPASLETLRRLAASDPDPRFSLECLEMVRRIQAEDLARLVKQRLDLAIKSESPESVRLLAEAQERYISVKTGVMLPAFMRRVPPIFTVKPAGQSIRVLAFGDFGNGSPAQKELAGVMAQYHRSSPFDFGVTLGDNFYSIGMESPDDPRWKTQWEDLYSPLKVPFYATLGNHDWGQSDSPAAELLYSAKSANWRMPAPYYTYMAGPVQFFALDTNELSDRQLIWLKDELAKSTAKWKVVYGHHHIYSAWRLDNATLISRLLPVLKGHADLYICGHDHNLQVLKPEQGLHFVVAGGGGAGSYGIRPYERAVFGKSTYGFAVLEADTAKLAIKLVEVTGTQAYEHVITK